MHKWSQTGNLLLAQLRASGQEVKKGQSRELGVPASERPGLTPPKPRGATGLITAVILRFLTPLNCRNESSNINLFFVIETIVYASVRVSPVQLQRMAFVDDYGICIIFN